MTTRAAFAPSRPPTTRTAAGALISLQVALAVAATSLAGFGLVYLLVVTFDTATGAERPNLVLPVALLVVAVLLSFVLLPTIGRLRRGEVDAARLVVAVEVLLAVTLAAFVATAGSGRPFVWLPAGGDLACCIAVVLILTTGGDR